MTLRTRLGRRLNRRFFADAQVAVLASGWLVLMACSDPVTQRRDGVDRMMFPDDSALEPPDPDDIPPPPPRDRRPRRAADALVARCANEGGEHGRSVGRATDGELVQGCELPERGPGYLCRHPARFGTPFVVAALQSAAAQVVRVHGPGPELVIGALSADGGGRLRPHRSHQSGRDADVGLFALDGISTKAFRALRPSELDVERTWTAISSLVRTGRVVYVFLDMDLQEPLFRYLERSDVDEATLERLFQYPGGHDTKRGLIRHASGHRDHFHVRFACGREDGEDCLD